MCLQKIIKILARRILTPYWMDRQSHWANSNRNQFLPQKLYEIKRTLFIERQKQKMKIRSQPVRKISFKVEREQKNYRRVNFAFIRLQYTEVVAACYEWSRSVNMQCSTNFHHPTRLTAHMRNSTLIHDLLTSSTPSLRQTFDR